MSAPIKINRTDLDAAGLHRAAGRSRDAAAARRMLASASVLDGASRADAARAAEMDRQTLCDWVHRYNKGSWPGCRTGTATLGPIGSFRPIRKQPWSSGSAKGPTLPSTAWYAGAG